MDNDQEEQDDVGHIPPDGDIDHGEDWHWLFRQVVHRGEMVWDANVPPYHPDTWTDLVKRAPYPFNLDATWYCGLLILLTLAVHVELDVQWLLRNRYLYYAIRVLIRAFWVLALSAFSTFSYEVVGNIIDQHREDQMNFIEGFIYRRLIVHHGWGEVDQEGNPALNNGELIWIRDPTNTRAPIRRALVGISQLCFNYCGSVSIQIINRLIRYMRIWGFIPVVRFFSTTLALMFASMPPINEPPTPDQNRLLDPKTLFWEYGIPALLQLLMSVFLWLQVFLYMSKAEWMAMVGRGRYDPKFMLYYNLTRATAMHLLAYTAYQITCACVVGINYSNYVFLNDFDPSIDKLVPLGTSNFYGNIGPAIILLVVHWLLQRACSLGVRKFSRLWGPIIIWFSEKTEFGVETSWNTWFNLMEQDFQILDLNTKVLSRVVMTAFFGLKSSWPARFRLSVVVDEVNLRDAF
ncbi:hypothetical protein F5X99DRAFT_421307 [Biscogniauxia marginata]|nr:hypothetical protein F5X99DRAFT_421307 [Biscogniauxia marginata]